MKDLTIDMLKELANNQEFIEKMQNAKNVDEAYSILTEYGMDLSREEFDTGIKQAIVFFEEKGYFNNDELTEESLESVSGGLNTGVANFGLFLESGGLIALTCGPVGWGAAAVALLGTGFVIATTGILMPGKKSKKSKKNKKR